MAVVTTTFGSASVSKLIRDTDSDTTVEANINSGSCTIQQIAINNTANASDPFYLSIWNLTSATLGTTQPHTVLFCPAGSSMNYVFPTNITFSTGVSIGGSKTNGAVASWSGANPTNSVAVSIYIA